jgi:hypothetical protein
MRVNRLSDEPGHDSDGVVSRTAIKLLSRVSPDTLGVNGILPLNRTYIGEVFTIGPDLASCTSVTG